MATQVWISTSNDPDRDDLGPEWRHAGDLDEHRETELWKVVQAYLGFRTFPPRQSVEFYADLDPDSSGYQELLTAQPGLPHQGGLAGLRSRFWLALRWEGPPVRILFATQQARLAPLKRRPPEPHPGLLKRPAQVGMRLQAPRGGFFDVR
jgi:hypothetical protein